jgi:hypothetical protein
MQVHDCSRAGLLQCVFDVRNLVDGPAVRAELFCMC